MREGTVIRATFRLQDLIPSFLCELRSWDEKGAEEISKLIPHDEIMEDAMTLIESHEWWEDTEAYIVLNRLLDSLNANAPQGMFFGSHPGDGSDYGWWKNETPEGWGSVTS